MLLFLAQALFHFVELKTRTDADFAAIEAKMAEIVKQDRPFVRREYSCADGLARTAQDKYKHDNAERAIACPSYREVGTSDHAPVVATFE